MSRKPDGSRRIVIAYMSIGEAETYRWYWPQRSSTWLGPENSEWRGNYGVRFWHPDWQAIIFEYTDKIIAAGFDGVYLDKVDEFEEMGPRGRHGGVRQPHFERRAKSQREDFLIVSQNGDALIPDPKFRRAIDAFAREDLFYGEDADGERNTPTAIRENIRRLKMLDRRGQAGVRRRISARRRAGADGVARDCRAELHRTGGPARARSAVGRQDPEGMANRFSEKIMLNEKLDHDPIQSNRIMV